jgi:hypothetical protein
LPNGALPWVSVNETTDHGLTQQDGEYNPLFALISADSPAACQALLPAALESAAHRARQARIAGRLRAVDPPTTALVAATQVLAEEHERFVAAWTNVTLDEAGLNQLYADVARLAQSLLSTVRAGNNAGFTTGDTAE